MAAPPGAVSIGHALVQEMVNVACQQPELRDVSTNKFSRIVRRLIAAGLHERDLVSWVIAYSDPTGEAAVRNVMGTKSQRPPRRKRNGRVAAGKPRPVYRAAAGPWPHEGG